MLLPVIDGVALILIVAKLRSCKVFNRKHGMRSPVVQSIRACSVSLVFCLRDCATLAACNYMLQEDKHVHDAEDEAWIRMAFRAQALFMNNHSSTVRVQSC